VEKYRSVIRTILAIVAAALGVFAVYQVADAMHNDDQRVAIQALTFAILALTAMEGVRFLED